MRAALHRQVQQVSKRRHRPQEQHVSRRIVAEVVRGVEVGDSVFKDALRPGGEAVDVGVVAAHPNRQHQAHDQRDGQADPQREAGALQHGRAILARKLLRRIALQAVAAARQRQNQHRVQRGQQQIGLGVALGRLIVGLRRGGVVGGLRLDQGEDLHALGPCVQLHGLHVVEVRAASVEGAVAAHAQHQRDLPLIRAGLAVDADLPPFPAGVQHRFGVDEGVPEGQRRAVLAVAAVLRAHHAAEAVVAVRLHGDGLDEAGVVGVGVDHCGAVAVAAVPRHVQPAHARVGEPHIPLPAGGHAGSVNVGKVAVDDQVFAGLREGSRSAEQQQCQQRAKESLHFEHKLLVCEILQLYHFPIAIPNSSAGLGQKRDISGNRQKRRLRILSAACKLCAPHQSVSRNSLMRSMAFWMFSLDEAALQRMWPSPSAPKAVPGTAATLWP